MRPDTLGALCAYMEAQAVSSARIVEVRPDLRALRFRAGDGAEAWITTDAYGSRFGWADSLDDALAALARQPSRLAPYMFADAPLCGAPLAAIDPYDRAPIAPCIGPANAPHAHDMTAALAAVAADPRHAACEHGAP